MVGATRGWCGRTVLLGFVLSAAFLLAGAAHAGVARAGSYVTLVCHDAAGAAMPVDLVSAQLTGPFSPAYFRTSNACAADGQGAATAAVGGCSGCGFGDVGVSYFLMPPAGVSIYSYIAQYAEGVRGCDMANGRCENGQGETFALDSQHSPSYAFMTLGPVLGGPYEVAASGLDAAWLEFFAGCNATYGDCVATGTVAALSLSSLTARLDDHTVPVVLAAGGRLIAGGPLSGTQEVKYTAQDSGGGIYGEHVYVDGNLVGDRVVDSNGGRCVDHGSVLGVRSFGYVQPCKTNVQATVSVDTTRWADGPHRLKIDIDDAAGDLATVFDGSVTSANAPAAPVGPNRVDSGAGPSGAGSGGPASAARGCTPAAIGVLAVGQTGRAMLSARLSCGGNPLASIAALVQDQRGLRRQVSTDSAGRFRIVTTRAPSHPTVTVSGTTVPIVTQLHAISLTISPRATTNHHAMTWRGLVTGGAARTKLLLEVRKGRRWDIFDQTSTGDGGRYRYRYTFRATTGVVRYTFRVVARDGSAISPSRKVLVRG